MILFYQPLTEMVNNMSGGKTNRQDLMTNLIINLSFCHTNNKGIVIVYNMLRVIAKFGMTFVRLKVNNIGETK